MQSAGTARIHAEKLLRSTDVGRVYVLMRGKRGDGIEERLERLLDSSVFHLLRGNEVLRKVVPVFGSLTAPERWRPRPG